MKVYRNTKCTVLLLIIVMILGIFPVSVLADSGWKCDSVGWWYETDGSYYKNEWVEIGGNWYHFNSRGYMEVNCYRGGYWLRSDGTWDRNFSHGTWKSNSKGWWFEDNGWYPKNTWVWIDGARYYFDDKGYMEHDCYRDGCWLNSNGMWDQNFSHGTWKRNSSGWWYEDNGWYPKNKWLQIDGTRYYFDNKGYAAENTNNSTVRLILDGMSANEIVANVQKLTKVSSSDAWSAYYDRFDSNDSTWYYLNASYSKHGEVDNYKLGFQAKKYISNFHIYGISENMDGTTVVSEDVYAVVKLRIDDYDLAVELFDKFVQLSSSYDKLESGSNRTGTTWTSSFIHSYVVTRYDGFTYNESNSYSISLSKAGDVYSIECRVY